MDVLLLSRIQFGLTASYHYLFPPMSIGLSWMILILEAIYLWKREEKYREMTKFWVRIFALFFAMGVATGFVQLFAFGNNWSSFSKFVGDVFGTLLAAEGVFAFFLEAGFIGIMLFGWDRVKPWVHFMSTCLVSIGATFSATWIVMANSWMQTPAGFKVIGEGPNKRAVVTDLWQVYFNPSFLDRITHVLLGCALMGTFLLVSVSAYYLLRKRHLTFARFTFKFSLVASFIVCILQLISADSTARGVSVNQPIKLAAMEGLYETEPNTRMIVLGIVDEKDEKVYGIAIPSLLSFLVYRDFEKAVSGLKEFPRDQWPHVPSVFYSYHTMIYCWGAMMLCALVGLVLWWRKKLEAYSWFLWYSVISIAFPYIANTAGWFTAEMGRQPWIVYNVLRTVDGASKVVTGEQVFGSIIMFIVIYLLLGSLFVFLLNGKIQHGPVDDAFKKDDAQYRDPFTLKS